MDDELTDARHRLTESLSEYNRHASRTGAPLLTLGGGVSTARIAIEGTFLTSPSWVVSAEGRSVRLTLCGVELVPFSGSTHEALRFSDALRDRILEDAAVGRTTDIDAFAASDPTGRELASQRSRAVLEWLRTNAESDGFVEGDVRAIATTLGIAPDEVTEALAVLADSPRVFELPPTVRDGEFHAEMWRR